MDKKVLLSAVTAIIGGILTIVSTSRLTGSDTEDHEEMSDELYRKIRSREGKYYADRAKKLVKSGDWSVDYLERIIKRPGIDPDDWQDFEDGWRPENW